MNTSVQTNGWGCDLTRSPDYIGMESLIEQINQGPGQNAGPSTFKPINIIHDGGVFYATIYVSECTDGTIEAQQLAIWLSSLKETDQINLKVLSLIADMPPSSMIALMAALNSTKAKLNIMLDCIVYDGLAYFYLIPEKITKGSEGALFIPSYMLHRAEDASAPITAMNDYFKWMTSEAVIKGILTEEEAARLQSGAHVTIPDDGRFDRVNNPRQSD